MATTYSFCESITGIGPWHIRRLTDAGQKLGGGIDTPSLCGLVRPIGVRIAGGPPGGGGWDLRVAIEERLLWQVCPHCVKVYQRERAGGPDV